MCSLNSSPVEAESISTLIAAAADVVAQSFFADAECASDAPDAGATVSLAGWLAATVRFEEAGCFGALQCLIPDALARALFDGFTGRGPSEPEPRFEEVCDLVGELSNMICGAWLTRLASHQAFDLSRPEVRRVRTTLRAATGPRISMRVNDLPLVLDVEMQQGSAD